MIFLVNGSNVCATVRDSDLMAGNRRYYAFFKAGYYDPENGFKQCISKDGDAEGGRDYEV